jgi:HEAT repeat protein
MAHQRGAGLPHRRVELYEECCELLLGYWDEVRGGEAAKELAAYGGLTRCEKRSLLEPLALSLHERGESGLETDQHDLEGEIARQFRDLLGDSEPQSRVRAELFLRVITERAGLLVERESGVYAFAHLTFQEYLAARAIADREDYIAYTLKHLHDPWWREVILLEVGYLSGPNTRRSRKLTTDLLSAIRSANSWLEPILERDLLFAARALADVGPLGVDDEFRQAIITEVIGLWQNTPYEPQRREVVEVFTYAMPTADGVRIRAELLHCLTGKVGPMRINAINALARIGEKAPSPEVVEHLLVLTANPDEGVRQAAAGALGSLGGKSASPEVLDRLLALAADPVMKVRWAAAKALGELGERAASPEVLDRLLALTAGPDANVRRATAVALVQVGEGAATPEEVERLLALTADADWSRARWAAAEASGQIDEKAADPEIVDRLLALTADPVIKMRCAAAKALGELGERAASPEVLDRLLALNADPDEYVRWAAAMALGQMGATAASGIVARIASFWQSQLADRQFRSLGIWNGRVCDLAYEELRRIGEQHGYAAAAEQAEAERAAPAPLS